MTSNDEPQVSSAGTVKAAMDEATQNSVRAGLDWFSGTLLKDAPRSAEFVRRSQNALIQISEEGNKVEARSLLGYTGYSSGNCFIGENTTRYFCQFTGHHANDYFADVYRRDMHVSRVDVQVSVRFPVMPPHIAKKGYKDAKLANDSLPAGRRRKIHIIIGSDGGDTLYVGSPSSEQRGRIYNKEVQSQDVSYERTWRYEVVFKNDYATNVCNTMPFDISARIMRITALAALWYEARGIETPWGYNEQETVLPLIKTLPSDVETKLNWIATQVVPSIQYLCDAGYRDTLKELLACLFVPPSG